VIPHGPDRIPLVGAKLHGQNPNRSQRKIRMTKERRMTVFMSAVPPYLAPSCGEGTT
jgi:hypothetical protein